MKHILSDGVMNRYFPALKHRDFRTVWTAGMAASAAAWALIIARGWMAYDLSDSSLSVGIVTFMAMIPRVVVTPFTGYLSDRFDRRNVLAAMFGLNLAHNIVLVAVLLFGALEVWHLVILAFVNGSARAAHMPAAQALIPNVVPRHLLLNAIALNQATNHGARLIGPLSILPLVAFVGVESAFVLCTAFYAVSLVQALRVRTASTGQMDRRRAFIGNLTEGLFYVYRTPIMRSMVIIAVLHCGLTMAFESLLPVLSARQLGSDGATAFTYLMMAVGGGALVSVSLLAGVQSERMRGQAFLYLGIFSGLCPAILAASINLPMAMVAAAGMGAAQGGFMTLTHTIIQSVVPDGVRGRVAGIYSMHVGALMASVNLVNGFLADYIDPALLLWVTGAAFIVSVLASWRSQIFRGIYTHGLRRELYVPQAA